MGGSVNQDEIAKAQRVSTAKASGKKSPETIGDKVNASIGNIGADPYSRGEIEGTLSRGTYSQSGDPMKRDSDRLRAQIADMERGYLDPEESGRRAGRLGISREDQEAGARTNVANLRKQLAAAEEKEAAFSASLEKGKAVGRELVAEGSLGRMSAEGRDIDTKLDRMDENTFDEGRSQETKDIIQSRKNIAEQGLSREEVMAQRLEAKRQIDLQTQQSRRQLQSIQAMQGVRGATAAMQQQEAVFQGMRTRADFERDLFLRSEQLKREGLDKLEQSVSAAEANEFRAKSANVELRSFNLQQQLRERELQRQNLERRMSVEQYNISQANREKFGQISTALGIMQMDQADTSADKANEAQIRAAEAASGSGGGGKF